MKNNTTNLVPTGHEVGTVTTVSGEILASFFLSFYTSKNNFKKVLKSCPILWLPNTDRVQGRQIENPLISKNHKRKRGSDSSSDCTLTIEGADTS